MTPAYSSIRKKALQSFEPRGGTALAPGRAGDAQMAQQRRKVWVTWQPPGGVGETISFHTGGFKRMKGATPFVEHINGDAHLTRDERKTLATIIKWMEESTDGRYKVIVEDSLRKKLKAPHTWKIKP